MVDTADFDQFLGVSAVGTTAQSRDRPLKELSNRHTPRAVFTEVGCLEYAKMVIWIRVVHCIVRAESVHRLPVKNVEGNGSPE